MNKFFIIFALMIFPISVFPQASAPKSISAGKTIEPAKDVVMHPMPITYGSTTIAGDIEVQKIAEEIMNITKDFQNDFTKLQDKYKPTFEDIQKRYNNAVDTVRKANGWGNDVVFDLKTNQWVKLSKEELEKMNNQK